MKCEKHLSECECPDLEERLASLRKIPSVSIAVAQNELERAARKAKEKDGAKPEDN